MLRGRDHCILGLGSPRTTRMSGIPVTPKLTWIVTKRLGLHSYQHPLPANTGVVPWAPLLAGRARAV